MYKLLAKLNKLLLPSFTKQGLDVSKAKKFLNWNTERTIEDAILDAWKWEQYRGENEIS